MILRSGRSGVGRAAGVAALALLGSIVIPASGPALAVTTTGAPLVVGFTESCPLSECRMVLNGWAFKRFGLYGVTINGTPTKAVSIAVDPGNRHQPPGADQLVLLNNLYNSALLDYVLWKNANTADPVKAAAVHITAWHLTGRTVGTPSIGSSGPTTPSWGPPLSLHPGMTFPLAPVDVTGAALPADRVALGDLIEDAARAMVTGVNGLLGPWTLDVTLNWGTKEGTVSVRSPANVGIPGVTVALSSFDSVVPSNLITDSDGVATFPFTPASDETTVTASAQAPGVHAEYDVQGDSVSGGYQRIAVGKSASLTDSFTIREPQITTFAKDAVDGDKLVGAGGAIVDTVQYQNFVPGATYTARVIWQYQDTSEPSSLTATKTFVASPTGSGSVDVGPITTGRAELGRSLVAYEFVYAGSTTAGFPEVIHANINDPGQAVTIQQLQLLTAARDTYDGDNTAFAGAALMDTVAYLGLAAGMKYTLQVEWYVTDGTNSLGSTGLTATKTFFADSAGFGTVDVGPISLTGAEVGLSVVAYERLYVGEAATGVPLGVHDAPDDPNQTIVVVPPNVLTVAQDVADGDKFVQALGLVIDEIVFANLHPGVVYTAKLEWHYTNGLTDLGFTGLSATKTFTPNATTGSVQVGPIRLSGAVSGEKLVAFQRIYLGPSAVGTPVVIHEVASDPAQTIQVFELAISTIATEGTALGVAIPGDKEIPLGPGATIVDTVTVQLAAGAAVVVTGYLVRYENGECSEPLSTVTNSLLIPANKTFTVVYTVPEAPGDYVSYIVVKNPGGVEVAQHQDCTSESQRVSVVGGGDLPETR